MSKQNETVVDSRVVELTLDNSTFEGNATKSISTIDKLKKALDFSDAGKGLDDISKSAKKIDMTTLSNGVNIVIDRFNALDAIAFSVLNNITNKVVSATEGFIKSVSVEQVSAGWGKYADKTSAVQTIMAATADKFADQGEQMEYVNEQLEKLNWFTDETSYSFLDMVSNIGKFTSNNIDLDKAVTAMEGISTWAAMSGANVQEAGRAMYNLSQAIGVGAVKLQDWKSIENANMATSKFKQTVIDTAEELGNLTKVSDGVWRNKAGHEVTLEGFNENLKDEWFDKEVLMGALDAYGGFTDELYNFMSTLGDGISTTSEAIGYINEYAEGTLDVVSLADRLGVSSDELQTAFEGLSSDALELGRSAFAAAQEAKTFQEAVDSVKEAVSTGWMNTFEILFGNYLDAKNLWTDLANTLYDVFAEGGNTRNDILKDALTESEAINLQFWKEFENRGLASRAFRRTILSVAEDHGIAISKMMDDEEMFYDLLSEGKIQSGWVTEAWDMLTGEITDSAETANNSLEEIREKALQVIRGDYGNDMDKRFADLAAEGFDPQRVQDYVNALKKATGGSWNMTDAAYAEADAQDTAVEKIEGVTEARLRDLGLADEEIARFREMAEEYEKAGKLGHFVFEDGKVDFTAASGIDLWTDSLYNLMDALSGVSVVFHNSINDVFPASSGTIYELISGFYKLTSSLVLIDSEIDDLNSNGVKLQQTLTGLFSVLDIVFNVVSNLAKGAITVVSGMFDVLGFSVLDVTAWLGELATRFDDFLNGTNLIENVIGGISDGFILAVSGVKEFVLGFGDIPIISKHIDGFGKAFNKTFRRFPKFVDHLGKRFDSFKQRTEALGGINLDNWQDVFKDFRENVLGYFGTTKVFDPIKNAFKDFFGDSAALFGGIGDYLKPIFDSIWNVVVSELPNVWNIITSALSNSWTMLTGAFNGLYTAISGALGYVWDTITTTLKEKWPAIQESLTSWFASLPEKLGGVKDSVFAFFSDVWSNITTALSTVWDGVSNAVSAAWPIIKEGFANLWTSIKDWFKNSAGIDLSFLETIFKGLKIAVLVVAGIIGVALGGIVAAIAGIVIAAKAGWKAISGFFKSIAKNEAVKAGITKIKSRFSGTFEKIKRVITVAKDSFDLFMKKLKSLGGFSFKNVVESFNFVKEKVFDYFSRKFPGFNKFREGFDKFTTKLKESLSNLGLDSEGLKSKWSKLTTFTGNTFTTIYTKAKDAGSKAIKAINGFINNPTVKKNLANFKAGFATLWDSLGPAFTNIKEHFKDFIVRVDELGGFKFDNLGNIWTAFKETIGASFKDFKGFDGIKTAVNTAWEDIKKYVKDHGFDISTIQEKFDEFTSGLQKIFEEDLKIPDIWDNFVNIFLKKADEGGDDITTESDTLLEKIGKFAESIKGLFTGEDAISIPDAFTNFISLFTNLFSKGTDKAGSVIKTESDLIVQKLTGFKTDVVEQLNNMGIDEKSSQFLTFLADTFSSEAEKTADEIAEGSTGIAGQMVKFVTDLKESVVGLEIPEKLTNFLSTFQHTQEAITNAGKPEEEGGTTIKDVIIGFITDIKDVLKEIPIAKIALVYKWIAMATGVFEFGHGINNFSKGFKDNNAANKFKSLALVIGAIGGVITAVLVYSAIGSMNRLKTTCDTLAFFLGEVATIFTAADIFIDKLGTGLGGGEQTKLTSAGQVVNNIFDKLFSEAGLIGVVLASGHALSELASTENFNADEAIKGAAAIATIVGVVMGMDWLGDLIDKLPSGAPDKSVLDVVGNLLDMLGAGLLVDNAVHAIRALLEVPEFNGGKAKEAAEAISSVVGVAAGVAGAIGLLGKFGINGGAAFAGLKAVGVVLLGSGATFGVLGIVGRIIDAIRGKEGGTTLKDLNQFVDEGADVVIKVAEKFGEVIGAFVGGTIGGLIGGIGTGMTGQMDDIGTNIVTFIEAVKPLEDDEHQVDKEKILGNLGLLVTTITEMSAAGLGVAVNDFFTSLLTELVDPNGEAKSSLDVFSESVDDIIAIVTKWNESFPDDNSIKFDKEGFDALVESVKEIPDGGLGGFLGRLFGVKSATGEFAEDMGTLGEGIKAFAEKAAGVSIGAEVLTAVRVIGDLAKAAAEVGTEAIYYQPFITLLMGEDGKGKNSIASALNQFAKDLKLDASQFNSLSKAARSAKDLSSFIVSVAGVAFEGSDIANTSLVTTFCNDIRAVVDALTYTNTGDYSMIDKFAESVEKVAESGLREAAESIGEAEKDGMGLIDFGEVIKNSSEQPVVSAPTFDTTQAEKDSEESKGVFVDIANKMIGALVETLSSEDNANAIRDAVRGIADTAISALGGNVERFKSVGKDFTSGFCLGMNDIFAQLSVIAAATYIGDLAVKALKRSVKSSSPSKESMKIGGYFWEGFTVGIDKGVDQTYRSSHGLGEAAVRGLRTSVRAINAMIDSGLDAQPVIRPVLDLTNIQNGSLALNGMLGGGIPIGVAGNLNAINANVNARNITTNADILSALTELGSSISRRPSQTNQYTINGITYDDGTNVSEAVRSLIHAAKIERRV